jgi:hypothetical protein
MWVRRAALLAHLHHKEQTNVELLEHTVTALMKEVFTVLLGQITDSTHRKNSSSEKQSAGYCGNTPNPMLPGSNSLYRNTTPVYLLSARRKLSNTFLMVRYLSFSHSWIDSSVTIH